MLSQEQGKQLVLLIRERDWTIDLLTRYHTGNTNLSFDEVLADCTVANKALWEFIAGIIDN